MPGPAGVRPDRKRNPGGQPAYGDRLEETESSGIYWKAVDLTYTVTGYVLQDLPMTTSFPNM